MPDKPPSDVTPTRWGLSKEGYPAGNVTPEQEEIWAREKEECLKRYQSNVVEMAAKWLAEVRHSPARRETRMAAVRKKYGQYTLKAALEFNDHARNPARLSK